MWSDPIDNALGNIQSLLERLTGNGFKPTADEVERAAEAATRAREVRAFEQQEGRIVTSKDGW